MTTEAPEEEKKNYRRFSKRITVMTLLWAMCMATGALIYRPELYVASMTWIVPLILGIIGAYQGIGHADYKAAVKSLPIKEGR